jgi:hypothetical protein
MHVKRWACTAVAGSLVIGVPALPAQAGTTAVAIVRAAGTCPASIALTTTSVAHEGGATVDVTAKTSAVAYVSELVSATPKRIEFRADLKPAYASCSGAGHDAMGNAFMLRGGKLSFMIAGSVSSGQYPVILELDVNGGDPHVRLGIAD